ncbi:MAG: cytochrome P450 [Rhizobiaceae bacterium]|nr:cytochrome P450 [Rhizobiaceae bacterium]
MQEALPYFQFDHTTRKLRLDPNNPLFVQNPYEAYAWLHERGSAFFWQDYGFWCFGGFDDVNRLLRDRKLGRQNPKGIPGSPELSAGREHLIDFDAVEAHSMLELEPPSHTKLRTLVNRAFVSRQVERLRPRAERLAQNLIDQFPEGPFDLLSAFAAPLPITIIAEMLGVPVEMGPQLLDWSHKQVAMYMHARTHETEVIANRAAREFSDFLRSYVSERRRAPGDDLLSLLIAAQEDGERLTEDELISSVILLLNAGHEATVHQTGNAVRVLLNERDYNGADLPSLFRDAKATAATVEECLRFDAPLHMFTRYVYEDTDFGRGIRVPAGGQIGLLLGMANRDPSAFDQPSVFLPERSDQKNVSFGAGLHFCIGAPLARIELQASLQALFTRLPHLKLAAPPQFGDTYHFHGLQKLVVAARGE